MEIEYKTIIDKDGYVVDLCVMFINGKAQFFEIKEGQQTVDRYKGNFIKPKLENDSWIETANEDYIKQWEIENMCKYSG